MKKIYGLLIAAALVAPGTLGAQDNIPGPGFSAGTLINMPQFQFIDMLNLSQVNYSLGTARSAAMAGAFTSLGADLSSMSINPAGLGMYRSSDVSISPQLTISSMENSRPASAGAIDTYDNNRTSFGLGNVAAAFNVYESAGGSLTSFTVGFGYNKLADFNYRNTYSLETDGVSIADVYMNQLRGTSSGPLNYDAYNPWRPYNTTYPTMWGAVQAYKSSLIDPVFDGDDNELYTINGIAPGAGVGHYMSDEVKGSLGEFTLSGGANFGNKFYLGLTLGFQNMNYSQDIFYEEQYFDNDVDGNHLYFTQFTPGRSIRGIGYNAKVGFVYRPLPELRIGAAFHTPTFMDLEFQYSAYMRTVFNDGSEGGQPTSLDLYYPQFTTPPRLLAGISYSFMDVAVLSVDYECAWYNGMRFKSYDADAGVRDAFKTDIKNQLAATSNVRVGLEVKPVDDVAIRLGYGYYGAALSKEKVITDGTDKWAPIDGVYDRPVARESNNITAGVGFRFNDFYVDAAYSYLQTKYTETDLYYYNGAVPGADPVNPSQYTNETYELGSVSSTLSKHAIMVTLGRRF